jgi:hypothetical protein
MNDEICTNKAEANKMVIKHNLNRQRNNARVSKLEQTSEDQIKERKYVG